MVIFREKTEDIYTNIVHKGNLVSVTAWDVSVRRNLNSVSGDGHAIKAY